MELSLTVVHEMPPLLTEEFRGINRYWDRVSDLPAAKILPGEFYVSSQGEVISTVLGSCVSACVRDRNTGIGGMNHFMLPRHSSYRGDPARKLLSIAGRYGNVAMERLINCVLGHGGRRENLEFKVFGGARVLDIDSEVGQQNITFISEYLRTENFKIVAQDLGGDLPRKIKYFPRDGRVMMKKLRRVQGYTLHHREQSYYKKLDETPVKTDVTFFTES